jgi:hypothetical protein
VGSWANFIKPQHLNSADGGSLAGICVSDKGSKVQFMSAIIPQVVVQVIATVSGVIISVGIPLILAKINKIGKVYTTLFGVDDVESMSGLVGVVESHDKEIKEIKTKQSKMLEKQSEVNTRVAELQTSVEQRTQDND